MQQEGGKTSLKKKEEAQPAAVTSAASSPWWHQVKLSAYPPVHTATTYRFLGEAAKLTFAQRPRSPQQQNDTATAEAQRNAAATAAAAPSSAQHEQAKQKAWHQKLTEPLLALPLSSVHHTASAVLAKKKQMASSLFLDRGKKKQEKAKDESATRTSATDGASSSSSVRGEEKDTVLSRATNEAEAVVRPPSHTGTSTSDADQMSQERSGNEEKKRESSVAAAVAINAAAQAQQAREKKGNEALIERIFEASWSGRLHHPGHITGATGKDARENLAHVVASDLLLASSTATLTTTLVRSLMALEAEPPQLVPRRAATTRYVVFVPGLITDGAAIQSVLQLHELAHEVNRRADSGVDDEKMKIIGYDIDLDAKRANVEAIEAQMRDILRVDEVLQVEKERAKAESVTVAATTTTAATIAAVVTPTTASPYSYNNRFLHYLNYLWDPLHTLQKEKEEREQAAKSVKEEAPMSTTPAAAATTVAQPSAPPPPLPPASQRPKTVFVFITSSFGGCALANKKELFLLSRKNFFASLTVAATTTATTSSAEDEEEGGQLLRLSALYSNKTNFVLDITPPTVQASLVHLRPAATRAGTGAPSHADVYADAVVVSLDGPNLFGGAVGLLYQHPQDINSNHNNNSSNNKAENDCRVRILYPLVKNNLERLPAQPQQQAWLHLMRQFIRLFLLNHKVDFAFVMLYMTVLSFLWQRVFQFLRQRCGPLLGGPGAAADTQKSAPSVKGSREDAVEWLDSYLFSASESGRGAYSSCVFFRDEQTSYNHNNHLQTGENRRILFPSAHPTHTSLLQQTQLLQTQLYNNNTNNNNNNNNDGSGSGRNTSANYRLPPATRHYILSMLRAAQQQKSPPSTTSAGKILSEKEIDAAVYSHWQFFRRFPLQTVPLLNFNGDAYMNEPPKSTAMDGEKAAASSKKDKRTKKSNKMAREVPPGTHPHFSLYSDIELLPNFVIIKLREDKKEEVKARLYKEASVTATEAVLYKVENKYAPTTTASQTDMSPHINSVFSAYKRSTFDVWCYANCPLVDRYLHDQKHDSAAMTLLYIPFTIQMNAAAREAVLNCLAHIPRTYFQARPASADGGVLYPSYHPQHQQAVDELLASLEDKYGRSSGAAVHDTQNHHAKDARGGNTHTGTESKEKLRKKAEEALLKEPLPLFTILLYCVELFSFGLGKL